MHYREIRVGYPRSPAFELAVERRPRGQGLVQHLRGNAMDGASVAEINAHPVSGIHPGSFGNSDLPRCRFVLCRPTQGVVVATLPPMQKTTQRDEEAVRGFRLSTHGRRQ